MIGAVRTPSQGCVNCDGLYPDGYTGRSYFMLGDGKDRMVL